MGYLLCHLLAAVLAGGSQPSHEVRPIAAHRLSDFLNSIGVNSSVNQRGETLEQTIACAKYLGVRWFRSGIEGNVPIDDLVALHRSTGALFSWSPGSGGSDLRKLLATARELAAANALLAFEGPNEPNNWGIEYSGAKGGANLSWVPVASFQRDLFAAVKADPVLKSYPVWGISENGAETDNVGLQFLRIPKGASTKMPEGTRYADFANVHNYVYHPNAPGLADNKTWDAADPSSACRVDGLYGEYGLTWAHHFSGYSERELLGLPRVTTETGACIDGPITEEIHALNLLSLYLDQFKRGWSHTAVYLLRDRVDEAGNQQYGFYKPDYKLRKAALYLHNLTTILTDKGSLNHPGSLRYGIPGQPATTHDLLLQKSDGSFFLIVWSEKLKGQNKVSVNLGASFSSAKLFDPTIGTEPVLSLGDVSSVSLALGDHPIVICLSANSKRPLFR